MSRNYIIYLLVLYIIVALSACGSDDGTTDKDTRTQRDSQSSDNDNNNNNTNDVSDLEDTYVPSDGDEIQVPDGEEIIPDIPEEPEVDEQGPWLLNVFADGDAITVHFNEPIDSVTGSNASNYRIIASDNSELTVTGARTDGEYVFLTRDLSQQINNQLSYELRAQNVTDLSGNVIDPQHDSGTISRPLFLAIVWHQHQPTYLDPERDELSGAWVRKHATKDYYDMTAVVKDFPNVHLNVNLTCVLLIQLEMYLDRLGEDLANGKYVDPIANTVDEEAFLAKWEGHTDPWIDMLLRDTPSQEEASDEVLGHFYKDIWATVSTSPQIMNFFPEYEELRDKNREAYTRLDLMYLKIFFELAWMDPTFLKGPVTVYTDDQGRPWVVDLSDVVTYGSDGKYRLNPYYTTGAANDEERIQRGELLSNRLVAENFKIMYSIIPLHKEMMFQTGNDGQIEVMTTPFYHPILPLIYDNNLATPGQPNDLLPNPAFAQQSDAFAHVAKARQYYYELFDVYPRGMWPGEGSVAEEVISIFRDNGVDWIATDQQVMERSSGGTRHYYPYMVDGDTVQGNGGDSSDEILIVFRDTEHSDEIGFAFQSMRGEDAANHFMSAVLGMAPEFGQPDRLVTIILDGENAWENYQIDHDGQQFFQSLYSKLDRAHTLGEITTVTVSEYIDGNPNRNVPPHPISEQREIEPLFPGSWIGATFAIWIGETEENQAWGYLYRARADLELTGLPRPNPAISPPTDTESEEYAIWKAWEEIYAAEGSDWYWWYGADMTPPGGDESPFDRAFRSHIVGAYHFINQALVMRNMEEIIVPEFAPIVQEQAQPMRGPFTNPPVINGIFEPNETEWNQIGGVFFDKDSSGTQASRDDDIAVVYYGYDEEGEGNFYLATTFSDDMSRKSNYHFALYTSHKHITDFETNEYVEDPKNTHTRDGLETGFRSGGVARELLIDFNDGVITTTLSNADGNGGWLPVNTHSVEVGGPVPGGRILEIKIPLTDLGMGNGDPLEILLVCVDGDRIIDTAPNIESKTVFDDLTTMVWVVFEADVSQSLIPINQYTDIRTLPPPNGNGTVYIAGNQDVLQLWLPNKIALFDDGTPPDQVANDMIWTRKFGFAPGTVVSYKYTIGLPTDEENWNGTEEFPLTERGYPVPNDGQTRMVTIRDIFADRPQPSGTMGPNAQVTIE